MSRRLLAGVALVALSGAAACRTAPATTTSDPVGCWYFDRNEAAAALLLPWGIRLGGDELTGHAGLEARGDPRAAATLEPDAERDHPFGYWLPIAGDSIEIGYPAGGGILLRVARGDTSMSGNARELGDAMLPGAAPRTAHAVRLTRAQCPTY